MEIKQIAVIHTGFPEKFGIPRQSGLVREAQGLIEFLPEYRSKEALRGLEGYSHIWVLWEFSRAQKEHWAATVTPPRLGGKKRMGVFATRSPFRPNPIGLSSVRLEGMDLHTEEGPVLYVSGADLMDGTPIYDIKPFIPYADNHPDALGGFTQNTSGHTLQVAFPAQWLEQVPEDRREALTGVLAHDPRPSYQDDPERIYGMAFAGLEVKFRVKDNVLTVCSVSREA